MQEAAAIETRGEHSRLATDVPVSLDCWSGFAELADSRAGDDQARIPVKRIVGGEYVGQSVSCIGLADAHGRSSGNA
jgi:hypothetical protein